MSTPNCVFCQIVAGESPASVVYQDDMLIGFTDIQPVTRDHTLLIPKARAERIADLAPETAEVLFAAASRIARALYDSMRCEGVNWFVTDGEAAGQDVLHFHLHIIPRYHEDGFGLVFPPGYRDLPTREALDKVSESIGESLRDD